MARKCFISFKTEDILYKKYIQEQLDIDMIDKSLNVAIDSDDEDYIMRKIRGGLSFNLNGHNTFNWFKKC